MSKVTAPRRVLVTGCSSGIGRAVVESLTARGHDVVGTVRSRAGAPDLAAGTVEELDVTDPASVERLVERVGPVDVLVNNAGIGMRSLIELATDDELRLLWETNVLGAVRMLRAVLPAMRERGSGRIVTVSSVAGRRSMPMTGHYAASKHAVEAIHEALRWEVREFGIDVALVEPGAVSSDFGRNRLGAPNDQDFGPYQPVVDRAGVISKAVNAPAESVAAVAAVIVDAVEAERVPLRIPTSADAVSMIADRTGRTDEEFENWLLSV